MTSRDKILGRIREALRVQAPVPGRHGDAPVKPQATNAAALRQWLPPVGVTWEEHRDLFARNSAALKTDFKIVPDLAAAAEAVKQLATDEGWQKLAAHRTPLLDNLIRHIGLEPLWTDDGVGTDALESCDAGITACEALVAQTGSVLVTSQSSGGRALSVLPPHHVVVATRNQLVPDLPAAFALLKVKYARGYPSMMSFITGPSRTGDIERILVLGAHGPKKLTVLCME